MWSERRRDEPARMNRAPKVPLAVIIPAFRARYLAETLQSLADQSCRDFRVYVADDASPEPIAEIVAGFAGAMDLVYRRFETNLGHRSLVGHWDRAIKLSEEPFIWIFSDDDVASPGCVARFCEDLAIAPESRALRRFDLHFIGADGSPLLTEPAFPPQLSGAAYARHLLDTLTATCVMQNMVFSRAIYDDERGFPDFPGGYCTDCAAWPTFARKGGVRRMTDAIVHFRRHATALSVSVLRQMEDWRPLIATYGLTLQAMRRARGDEGVPTAEIRRAEIRWFCRWFRYYPRKVTQAELAFAKAEMRKLWPGSPLAWRGALWVNYTASQLRRHPLGHRLLGAVRNAGFGFGR